MDQGTQQGIWSAIRSLLMVAGMWLATHKYIDAAGVNEIVGALMVLLPAGYGVWQKQQAEKDAKAREAKALNVGIAVADATPGKTAAIAPENAPKIIAAVPPAVPAPTHTDILATVAAVTGVPVQPLAAPAPDH